ncbi:MAG: 23S rRNA pseudouridine(1911/1915/1917) synthase RluD [Xanthomonadaceae bacterium]|nr:23S rRNA pseudouridine(1911/1915/1917) synthase RluD [Xanthomonadaceae bacterium]MDE1886340.1 23S rRNA pseudouridine(1911/1915/1917) synthase RluD [Xanthomonadaceae bacterium]MDE2084781.1 23S rRNA pseudouridine(1911/1915/1917) synthase RluD [Xanthomonadaceae bacterium]MDE2257412.1 23S rRNA pseudouridine(1911/1915/1917) synthase RluD [Xanthomonadaceae bacterium]
MDQDHESRRARLPPEAAGRRLDQALAGLFPEFSRSRLTAWIKSGDVRVDGAAAAPRQIVRGGEAVTLRARTSDEVTLAPEAIALDIRYEDADVIVVNKPAGLTVHPGAGQHAGTLQNALLHHDPELAKIPRAGIVHRLDKDTSGVMVVARSLRAHTALVEQLQARAMHRQYLAIVYGSMIAGGSVDAPIGRHPRDRLKQAIVEEPAGKPAVTHYRVRERFRAHTLIECRLETGRTHQIRVHMAHVKHALVGDQTYGTGLKLPKGATPELGQAMRAFRRQALHAETLEFAHPADGRAIRTSAEMPADMQALLAALRADTQASEISRSS